MIPIPPDVIARRAKESEKLKVRFPPLSQIGYHAPWAERLIFHFQTAASEAKEKTSETEKVAPSSTEESSTEMKPKPDLDIPPTPAPASTQQQSSQPVRSTAATQCGGWGYRGPFATNSYVSGGGLSYQPLLPRRLRLLRRRHAHLVEAEQANSDGL